MSDAAVVNVVELRRRLGTRRSLSLDANFDDLAVGSTFVPADHPVHVALDIESVSDGVITAGHISADWIGECRRCLEPVDGQLDVAVQELFADAGDPDEIYLIDGDVIDLANMIHDTLMLNLPQAPLCRADCRGPDPDHYPALVESDDRRPDPRWSALSELRLDE